MKKLIAIGRILRPWGNRGEVRIAFLSGRVKNLKKFTRIYIGNEEREAIPVFLERERRHRNSILAKFLEYPSMEEAQALRGKLVYVQKEELTPLKKNEYYINDLIGMRVFLKGEEEELGYVTNVLETGGTDLLEIHRGKKSLLIPLAKSICEIIDLKKRSLIINPPKGLLDLNEI